jgi:hypothetical protein
MFVPEMDAIQMFSRQHAQVHAAEPGQAEGSLADMGLRGVSDEHIRRRPREGLEDLIDAPALSRVTAAGVFGEGAGWVLPEAICVRSQAGLDVGYWNTGEFS